MQKITGNEALCNVEVDIDSQSLYQPTKQYNGQRCFNRIQIRIVYNAVEDSQSSYQSMTKFRLVPLRKGFFLFSFPAFTLKF